MCVGVSEPVSDDDGRAAATAADSVTDSGTVPVTGVSNSVSDIDTVPVTGVTISGTVPLTGVSDSVIDIDTVPVTGVTDSVNDTVSVTSVSDSVSDIDRVLVTGVAGELSAHTVTSFIVDTRHARHSQPLTVNICVRLQICCYCSHTVLLSDLCHSPICHNSALSSLRKCRYTTKADDRRPIKSADFIGRFYRPIDFCMTHDR